MVLNSTRTASLTPQLNRILILRIDLTLQKEPRGIFLYYSALEGCLANIALEKIMTLVFFLGKKTQQMVQGNKVC